MVAFVSLKREAIQRAVRDMYTAVAIEPQRRFHFPTGRAACEQLGYPRQWLDALPERALESFAGVGYPFAADAVREGDHATATAGFRQRLFDGTDPLAIADMLVHA